MKTKGKSHWNVVAKEARTIDGIVFDSGKEAARYAELKLMEKAGEIFDVRKGQRSKIFLHGIHVATYTPDFLYITKNGELIIEEVKSTGTVKNAYYKMRKRLYEAYTGNKVTEVIR